MSCPIVNVGDLCEQVRGVSYKKAEASSNQESGKKPILRANNITENGLDLSDLVYVPAERINDKQRIRKHDIVVATSSGSLSVVGKTAQARSDFDCGFGAFCKVLRPKNEVDPNYFAHYFKTPEYRHTISNLAAGANINNLRNEHINDLKIPLPAMSEQKRIASVLDRVDALRTNRKQAFAKLDELLQSVFLEMFGDPVIDDLWPTKKVENLVLRIIDYRGKTPKKVSSGIPLITAKLIKNKSVLEPTEYIATNDYEPWMRRGIPNAGDVLITTEAPMGEVAQVPDYKLALAQRLLALQPNKQLLNSKYLMWALSMPATKNQLARYTTGSTVTGIRQKNFREILIPVPPIEMQNAFNRLVEVIDSQKWKYRYSLKQLNTLFASLQQRAFKGEL